MAKLALQDIKQQKKSVQGAFCEAVHYGRTALVEALLYAGANPNDKDGWDSTVLHSAVRSGKTVIVLALLKAGADHKATDKARKTAYDLGMELGRTEGGDWSEYLVRADLTQNPLRQWRGAAIAVANTRALQNHPLRNSFLPLIPRILQLADGIDRPKKWKTPKMPLDESDKTAERLPPQPLERK